MYGVYLVYMGLGTYLIKYITSKLKLYKQSTNLNHSIITTNKKLLKESRFYVDQ